MSKNLSDFKKSYEEFISSFENFQLNLKDESSEIISYLVREGRFDETQIAVDCLRDLFTDIHFDYKFSIIEEALETYNSKIKSITSSKKTSDSFIPEQIEKFKEEKTRKDIDFEKNDFEKNIEEVNSVVDDISTILQMKNFQLMNTSGKKITVKKRNKNIQFAYVGKDEFSDQNFVSMLNEMNELKSIGFIFDDALSMKKSKLLLEEWVKSKPRHETRFLSVNFSNLEVLEKDTPFEVVEY